MKKVLIMLCVVLLLAAPTFFVQAEEPTASLVDEVLSREANQLYKDSLYAAGKSSFHGMCGLATSYQLWKLGINEDLLVYDGNKQFDAYKNLTITTGGYSIQAYSAESLSLQDALNTVSQNGTRTVRNILVGFQWTDTEAGAYFGHCCVINAIQDGLLYFTESFDGVMGKREGKTITCTVEEFVDFYDGWTTYEGIVVFGTKQYASSCQSAAADLYVQLRFDSNLRSQPCLLGQNGSIRLRSLSAGEILHATAIYASGEGDLFYQVDGGGVTGYVSANAVHLLQYNEVEISLDNVVIPGHIKAEEALVLTGNIHTTDCQLTQLRLDVTDDKGNLCLQFQTDVAENTCDLSVWNGDLKQHGMGKGSYTLILVAETESPLVDNGELVMKKVTRELLRQPLLIDVDKPETPETPAPETQETPETEELQSKDGWFVEEGIWYYYEEGQPCAGWVSRLGVKYFLQNDGSVTTGWLEQSGKTHHFSATGALSSDWFTTPEGTYYWPADGEKATGITEIDGVRYYFYEDGRLATGGLITVDDVLYRTHPDGTITQEQ